MKEEDNTIENIRSLFKIFTDKKDKLEKEGNSEDAVSDAMLAAKLAKDAIMKATEQEQKKEDYLMLQNNFEIILQFEKKSICFNGHAWGPEHEERWQDTGTDTDTGNLIVHYDYWAIVRICTVCEKREIINGSASGRQGTEYFLEPDGSLGGRMGY